MKFLGFFLVLTLWACPSLAWDCQDPAVDCSTLIVQGQPAVASLSSVSNASARTQKDTTILKVPDGTDPNDLMRTLSDVPGVTLVEPAFIIELAQGGLDRPVPIDPSNPDIPYNESPPTDSVSNAPDDPLFDQQSHFAGSIGDALDIDGTWSRITDSQIIVAIIDSGIDYEHPDLKDNVWHNIGEIPANGIDDDQNGYIDDSTGYNFFDGNADPYDEHMHGTHIAGIIGAVGNNGIGVTGILWDVQLMGLRFTDEDGIGNTAKAIEAIHYAVNHGARVINMSWTVKASSSSNGSTALRNVIRSYSDQGVVFLAAAGNGDSSYNGYDLDEEPVYPAAIESPNLLSVAAANSSGNLAFYSNYGVHSVHIMAPGNGILSTMPDNQYGRMTGTSAATGLVSAAAAMILTEAPYLTAEQVKNLLINTSNVDPALSGYILSSGSLNLFEPLESVDSNKNLSAPDMGDTGISSSNASVGGGCSLMMEPNVAAGSSLPIAMILFLTLLAIQRRRMTPISPAGEA